MEEKAMMVRTVDGRYWLNHRDDLGRLRSSYLGDIGAAAVVEAWCGSKGIEFRQAGHASATAARARRESVSGRNTGARSRVIPARPAVEDRKQLTS